MRLPARSQPRSARPALSILLPWLSAATPRPNPAEIHRHVAEILNRPEFTPRQVVLWEWLGNLLERFFHWLGSLHQVSPNLFWIMLAGCLLLLFLLVGHLGWTVRNVFFVDSGIRGAEKAAELRGRLSGSYWEEARRKAAEGEYTEAVRFLFLSLVYRFDEAGRVSFRRAYTNREYLELFADRPEIHAELKVFVDTLDQDWYGERPTEQRQYEHCLALYEALQHAVERGSWADRGPSRSAASRTRP